MLFLHHRVFKDKETLIKERNPYFQKLAPVSAKQLVHLALEQHGLNCMHPLIHTLLRYGIVNVFSFPYNVLNYIFFTLPYFIARIQQVTHMTCKICVNQLFVLLIRLPAISSLVLGELKVFHSFLTAWEVSMPNPCIVQGSTVYLSLVHKGC